LDTSAVVAALSRTLVTDRDFLTKRRASETFYEAIKDVVYDLETWPVEDKGFLEHLVAVYSATRNRQLITSQRGHIGLCTRDAREGDLICILLGVRVPLILRKQDDHYVIIGDCYVDGIMDGETIPDMESGKFKVEKFDVH
jgi:hypothetical protein